jgi:hypothetical protein
MLMDNKAILLDAGRNFMSFASWNLGAEAAWT